MIRPHPSQTLEERILRSRELFCRSMGETSSTTLVRLWRQCKHCGPIITLILLGLRTHPRQFSGEFHTHGCRWQTEFARNPDDQRRSPVWNQSHLSIVSICVIHHRVPIRIHEVKVTQGCEGKALSACERRCMRQRVDDPCQIVVQDAPCSQHSIILKEKD